MEDFDLKKINSNRKKEHLELSLDHGVEDLKNKTGFADYFFIHNAVPEISFSEIDTSTEIFGKKLKLPLMISPMVGGIEEAEEINKNLARAASFSGIAMGVGSQRIAIEEKDLSGTFNIREYASDIFLFANLGAVQLNYGFGLKECRKAIDMIGADALFLHLNPLQEALQKEGNHNFKNLLPKIKKICEGLEKPVLIREVGFGISREAALKLKLAGVRGIDVGGFGGTSWLEIEKARLKKGVLKQAADFFSSWGIPTAKSILMVKESCPDLFLIASGGIRSGIDIAKSIALGADIVGIALPFLKLIKKSEKLFTEYLQELETGLKIAMFCIGAQNIAQLKNNKNLKNVKNY